jgi:hypothetical protein
VLEDVLSQADIILPTQYFGTLHKAELCNEQRLMLAVLVDAINLFRRGRGGNRALAEAARWVDTRGTAHVFSFDNVCEALEIESEGLRSRLRALTAGFDNPDRPRLKRLRINQSSRTLMVSCRLQRRSRSKPEAPTTSD